LLSLIEFAGANSGVGFATSKILACASSSYHIIMTGRSEEKLRAAIANISALPDSKGTLSAKRLDVTDDESIKAVVDYVEQQFGHLDVLVNNAGVGGLTAANARQSFQRCLETNVTGPAVVADAFRPLLLKSQNPYSLYLSSGARTLVRNAMQKPPSHDKIKNGGAYQVSKAALNMLAVLEARDYGSNGLKVFAVSPGFVRSNLRGSKEEEKSGWGMAGDADDSGNLLLSIVRGERDADVGCLVHKDGVYAW
jgi:NAD(P)-dependent dehydrogenase (short-subunit alcohol dehydrogenase family)